MNLLIDVAFHSTVEGSTIIYFCIISRTASCFLKETCPVLHTIYAEQQMLYIGEDADTPWINISPLCKSGPVYTALVQLLHRSRSCYGSANRLHCYELSVTLLPPLAEHFLYLLKKRNNSCTASVHFLYRCSVNA